MVSRGSPEGCTNEERLGILTGAAILLILGESLVAAPSAPPRLFYKSTLNESFNSESLCPAAVMLSGRLSSVPNYESRWPVEPEVNVLYATTVVEKKVLQFENHLAALFLTIYDP